MMEWREQSAVSCEDAFSEAQRWIEAVTKKTFGSNNFRSALENGVLLCDLVNRIKPSIIKRVNRLSTPIAGLDNLNVFLRACGKLGLKEAQLFHPGDLQDLSSRVTIKRQETSRRLKNVLITLYWLGRTAQNDPFYHGPYLNLKAFEGLLGIALSKALEDSVGQSGGSSSVRDSGFGDGWYCEREDLFYLRGGGRQHRRENSLDSLDSEGSRPPSISSDTTLKDGSEGCFSDAEVDSLFKMADSKDPLHYRRSLVVTPKTATQFNQFLPTKDKFSGYVPAPLRKKRAERQEDNRRSWVGPQFTEEDGTFTRSKSMSDISVDPASLRQVRYEELQKIREQVKESEDQWQDDLTKWKNRRRSVNSDIVKKKEEREEVEQFTLTGSSSRRSKTFREMQEERENRDTKSSLSNRLSSLTSLDQDVFEEPAPAPRTRTLPTRSYTVDSPYAAEDRPTARSVPPLREDPPSARLEPNRAILPPAVHKGVTGDLPTASSRSSIFKPSNPPATMEISCNPVNTAEDTSAPAPSLLIKAPESRLPWASRQAKETPSFGPLDEQPQPGYSLPPGVSRVSASLPRSYQRSDSARLTSVVTARPFGTQSTRITSLPRAFTMDESLRRVNGEPETASKPPPSIPVLGRYGQAMTFEHEARSSSAQSSNEEEEEEEEEEERSGTPTPSVSPVVPQIKNDPSGPQTKAVSPTPVPVSPTSPKDTNQESFCDMRISLNQKPNSSTDFGFHADWDSTGVHITSMQTGSPAEQCQLQLGDEVLAVSGHKVSDMSYPEWKGSLEDALQQGSLVLDLRRHGKNHWDRDHPSLPFKSHKIINLTSMDHPTLVGGPDKPTVNTTSLDFTSSTSTQNTKEVPSHPIIDMASNGVNGGFRDKPVTLRNKESEPISLKNLKRRSEFFEQGGSESAISDLAVPSIAPSSSRWSWDPEEERRRQEKWQREQEVLLQEKYKRDQEKLEEEWRRAQQDAVNQGSTHQQEMSLEVENNRSISPHSPLSPLSQPTPPWQEQEESQAQALEEERSRLEEQERRRQEEERRKREEEERDLERLQEERKRLEQEEEKERRRREEEELRWQRKRQEEREEERRRQEEQQRKDRERDQENQRGGDSYGYAQVQPELSMTDRVKSKSTPHLDDVDHADSRGRSGRPGGMAQRLLEEELRRQQDRRAQGQRAASQLELERRDILNAMRYREPERVTSSGLAEASWGKKGDSLSQSEAERQQILREMKKKTQLLTDNSWIRQRSTSTTTSKEPIDLAGPIRRGDSLDNLDAPRSSWRSSWTPGSTSSIPNYSRPHSAMSASGGGAGAGGWARPGSATFPSSYSMSSLRAGGGNPSSSWSQRSSSPTSPSPTTSPEPPAEHHLPSQQQRSRSVSGKKICTLCDSPLGKGAAMIIESLGLCYHLGCFKCIDCLCDLGGSEAGAEVRIRNKQLYCNSCYVRFKTGQPTSM
ncbi:LIM domain only protein 7 isoform X3 [Osmerus eperlanus]|uniref:LIM domain only protein 7 isoform X3 n=1 Tax=Osmerus eperlanus TaxID=29151 RepID=UPI002E0DC26E